MKFKKIIRYGLMRYFYMVRDKRKISIYFDSFGGQYSDSPKAISEEIHKLKPNIELIWVTNGANKFPNYIKLVKKGSIASIKAMAQSKIWVTHGTGNKNDGFWKGKDTLSIATWHGDRGFKKIGFAAYEDMKERYHHSNDLLNFSDVDYLTVGSEYGIKQAREGLGYKGNLLCHGLPRNDKLVRISEYENEILSIKKSLGIPINTKILLYAPTFRDNELRQQVKIDINRTINSISSDGNQWMVLIRAHSHAKRLRYEKNKNCLDVSGVGDMADLLLITDCLLTDYSSSAGDFILTDKPCILAHFDRLAYESKSRSLWFDPDESGFLIAKNQKELDHILSHIHDYDYKKINKQVLDFYGTFETGESSYIVAKTILSWLNTK